MAIKRCGWCKNDALYQHYHDVEWGVPQYHDQKLFEMLILEGMQAGLSWITVLRRRENLREVFNFFDPKILSEWKDEQLNAALKNPKIIRNRLKVFAVRQNAMAFLAIQKKYGSFQKYIWQFVDGQPKQNQWRELSDVPAKTPESDAMSKDLKKRGFSFVGSTICYAYMQAVGMVNDHILDCYRHAILNH